MATTEYERKHVQIRQVYAENLKFEFSLISESIKFFPYVSMDTEFPGTIYKTHKDFIRQNNPYLNYKLMKDNVDSLKIIQLGLTLSDPNGNLPNFGTPSSYIWEFNFKDFDIDHDPHDKDSIELLKKQGIDFAKNREMGVSSSDFMTAMLSSGLVFNTSSVIWLTFHGAYDFGFLVKVLTQAELPPDMNLFLRKILEMFGLYIYDMKYTFRLLGMHGGLEKIAKELNVDRGEGKRHTAGSDSLLTLLSFFELKKMQWVHASHLFFKPLAFYGLDV